MSRSRLIGGLGLLVLAVGLGTAWKCEAILTALCSWLDVSETPRCAEHVLVLPGDDTYRPITAAAVVKAGLAKDVLIPQTIVSADVKDGLKPPTANLLRQILEERGIPSAKILCLAGASRTTLDDARALLTYVKHRPQDRIIVVTNAYHTRRARFTFRRVLGVESDHLQFVAAPNPGFTEGTWWQNRFSMNMVLSENLKLGFYVFRYSSLYGWMGSLLLIAILWRWRQRHGNRRVRETASGRLTRPLTGWRLLSR